MIESKTAVVEKIEQFLMVCPHCGETYIEEDADNLLSLEKCPSCGNKINIEYNGE